MRYKFQTDKLRYSDLLFKAFLSFYFLSGQYVSFISSDSQLVSKDTRTFVTPGAAVQKPWDFMSGFNNFGTLGADSETFGT